MSVETMKADHRTSRSDPTTGGRVRWWAWATVAAAAVVTAACGSNGGNGGSASKVANVHVPANFCGLLTAADISKVMDRTFPAPQGTQSPSEAQCDAVPSTGNDVSFKLYFNDVDCIGGKPANEQCLNSQAKGFATNKQTAGPVQDIPGLGDQAFCFVGPLATVDVLKSWVYLTVEADTCPQAQRLAAMLLTKVTG
jgi:hypothetical protein